jgi:hypothetical protein
VLWRYDVVSSENCKSFKTVLVLSGDSLVRTAIVQLLRDCGYLATLSAVPSGCPIVLDGLAFGALPEAWL